MKKIQARKLILTKESLRQLAPEQMDVPGCNTSQYVCATGLIVCPHA
jgi:hypothetical protein